MLINLLPDFVAVLQADDPVDAYARYLETHRGILDAYWHNYVIDPVGPQFEEIVTDVVRADRSDLNAMLSRVDVPALAQSTWDQCRDLFGADVDVDVVVMVGVGAANAGELVVDGRAIAFVCLEHFTGIANPSTHGLGLDPELLPMWLAHELAHGIRYTSPASRSELSRAVSEAGGYYSYWETARQVRLREHLANEGLAVLASQRFSPGHAPWEYFGYGRRQYSRVRELESVIARAVTDDLDRAGLGLRLRYLSGGMTDEARTVQRYVIPERSGYYIGARMVESAVTDLGLISALRADATQLTTGVAAQQTA